MLPSWAKNGGTTFSHAICPATGMRQTLDRFQLRICTGALGKRHAVPVEDRYRPGKVGRRPARLGIGLPQFMAGEPAVPRLGRNGVAHLGEIGDGPAVRPVTFGLQQSQHGHVDAALARRPHDRLGILPPRQRDRHRGQRANHHAVRRHQHEPGSARRLRRRLVKRRAAHISPGRWLLRKFSDGVQYRLAEPELLRMLPYSISSDSHVSASPRDAAFYQDPHAFYKSVHAVSPTFFWEDYGHWCFAGFGEVSALLRDKRFGRQILHVATREQLGLPEPKPHTAAFDQTEKYSLLNLEPPAHTRLRALVNRAFVSRHVEQLRPRIERLANELIDGFAADGEVELLKAYAAPIPAIVIAEMIGLPADMAMQLVSWSNRMVTMYMFGVTRETELDANQASAEFMDYLGGVIAERRSKPREDLLTHMITAEIDGQKLSDEEILSTAILLLNAGHEATVHTTGNGIKAILESGIDPSTVVCRRSADRGHRRGMPALRRAAAYVHALCAVGYRARGRPQFQARRHDRADAGCRQPRPDALRRCRQLRPVPQRSAPTSRSAPASISASARRSPGSNCRWR